MSTSSRSETGLLRHLARGSAATVAIAAFCLGASSLSAHAATTDSRHATIAPGATRVVVEVNRGLNAKTDRFSTYATTNEATISAFIGHVDALPAAKSGTFSCPMDVGATLTLDFYRHATTPYAIVVADPGGCGTVSVREYNANHALASSALLSGGVSFSAYVAQVLHIKTLQVL